MDPPILPVCKNSIWPMHPPYVNYNYDLQIERRKYANTDGSKPNQGVAAAVQGLGKTTPIPWNGPVIVTRKGIDEFVKHMAGGSIRLFFPGNGDVVEDITMADFRCFVEWVAEYSSYQERLALDPISRIRDDFMRALRGLN
ncbi:hypothetical protein SLS53_005746 [Cytospora paraplurivora]|uniref:Uncharacterized protein n=1 Tax=Cytospora paraplurivora TaxID=2898453 RepID=A0AAN9U5K9_9PEZI